MAIETHDRSTGPGTVRRPLTLRIRAWLFIGFCAWCLCMVLPCRWRIWWSLIHTAGFYAYFDRETWDLGGYDYAIRGRL